jgi:hypothetical protein
MPNGGFGSIRLIPDSAGVYRTSFKCGGEGRHWGCGSGERPASQDLVVLTAQRPPASWQTSAG